MRDTSSLTEEFQTFIEIKDKWHDKKYNELENEHMPLLYSAIADLDEMLISIYEFIYKIEYILEEIRQIKDEED